MEYKIPDSTANKKALSKFNSRKNLKPTNIAIPNKAIEVPIQKLVAGFDFKKTYEIIPTHKGDKLVSNEAWVALDSCMAIFQTPTSEANKIPQRTAKSRMFVFGNLNFFVIRT